MKIVSFEKTPSGRIPEITDKINAINHQLEISKKELIQKEREFNSLVGLSKKEKSYLQSLLKENQNLIENHKDTIIALTEEIEELETDKQDLKAKNENLTNQIENLN